MTIPEGANTVTIEGADLVSALSAAAEQLGIEPVRVAHKLDLTHFRSNTGVSVARSTVKIIAWAAPEPINGEILARPPRPRSEDRDDGDRDRDRDGDRGPRSDGRSEGRFEGRSEGRSEGRGRSRGRERDRDRPPRDRDRDRPPRDRDREPRDRDREPRSEGKPRGLRQPEGGETEASKYAQEWFSTLLQLMEVEGNVAGSGNDERVHLAVRAERAGRIIGKRGATLGAIRHLLGLALERRFTPLTVDVDVDDLRGEGRPIPADSPPERGSSGDDRKRRRRRRDDGAPSGGGGGGRFPEEKLRALALRAAEKAKETGQTITIKLDLNSYDRRIIHVEVAEVEGVTTHSEEVETTDADGNVVRVKYVQVVPE